MGSDELVGQIYQLTKENEALKEIIMSIGRYDQAQELERFRRHAAQKYPTILDQGWSDKHNGFNNAGLNKRWKGWLECAKSREIKP